MLIIMVHDVITRWCMYTALQSHTLSAVWSLGFVHELQWRIQGGIRTPHSASTSLIIQYSQSMYDSLHDTAQLALAPSEKTITGATSSRYALEVDRTSEQSAGLRAIHNTMDL